MSQILGVMIDVDGTLVDSNDAHATAWVEALAQHGYDVPFEKVRRAIGMGGDNLLPAVVSLDKNSPDGQRISKTRDEIFERHYLPKLTPFPKVRELVQRLQAAGLKLVIASSSSTEQLDALLRIARVDDLIETHVSSNEAKNSKPDPDIIQVALNKLGLPADQAVMLGDTPYDISSASKAGSRTIALRCGGWDTADLKDAVAVYDSPADLLAHFDESPLAVSQGARQARLSART
ncbi:MAG: HAD family hydrolase [Anaerolineae bacterium]